MLALAALTAHAADLEVRVTGLDGGGVVWADLFDRAEGYPTRAEAARARRTVDVTGTTATLVFSDLPPGTYALSVVHDVNANGRIDTWWFGPPKEPLGASRGAKGRFGPPSFADASFVLSAEGGVQNVAVTALGRSAPGDRPIDPAQR